MHGKKTLQLSNFRVTSMNAWFHFIFYFRKSHNTSRLPPFLLRPPPPPQFCPKSLFSISLETSICPKRNQKQCLVKEVYYGTGTVAHDGHIRCSNKIPFFHKTRVVLFKYPPYPRKTSISFSRRQSFFVENEAFR